MPVSLQSRSSGLAALGRPTASFMSTDIRVHLLDPNGRFPLQRWKDSRLIPRPLKPRAQRSIRPVGPLALANVVAWSAVVREAGALEHDHDHAPLSAVFELE